MRDYPLDQILLPMNASSTKNEDKLEALWDNDDYVAEEKYDGSRYLCIGGRFFSRRISDIDGLPVEKTANVPHLAERFNLSKAIYDGEIYYPGQNSNDVTAVMGSLPERAKELQEQNGYLHYVIFDILRTGDGEWLLDKPWHVRRKMLMEHWAGHPDPYISTSYISYRNEKRILYRDILTANREGIMFKNINGLYVPDKRPAWNWVKVKKHMTDDVVILGYQEPVREYTGKDASTWDYWDGETAVTKFYSRGWIGAIVFGQYNDQGQLVELGTCSGMNEEIREELSKHKEKYIGSVIEISAMEKTKDGYYRHPQFIRLRDDKNAKDCILD